MCVNGQRGGAVGNGVCGLWESEQLFQRDVNICFHRRAAVFHISIVLFWNIGSSSCCNQSIDGQGNIPGSHQQPPDQDKTADHSTNNKVQQEQRKSGSQRAARHDPGKHPRDAKRQAAKDEQPYIVGDSIFCVGRI